MLSFSHRSLEQVIAIQAILDAYDGTTHICGTDFAESERLIQHHAGKAAEHLRWIEAELSLLRRPFQVDEENEWNAAA